MYTSLDQVLFFLILLWVVIHLTFLTSAYPNNSEGTHFWTREHLSCPQR